LRVEHVVLTLSIAHPDLSQVEVSLQSPRGTSSLLLPANSLETGALLNQWPFTSIRHWGELAGGTWQVRISDLRFLDTGSVTEARLELYGALLPEPVLGAPTPHTLLIALPAVDGLTATLEATSQFNSWLPVSWTAHSNRIDYYQISPPSSPYQFFRVRWSQP
jgi:subtilisin-like proprotein convertase family protein